MMTMTAPLDPFDRPAVKALKQWNEFDSPQSDRRAAVSFALLVVFIAVLFFGFYDIEASKNSAAFNSIIVVLISAFVLTALHHKIMMHLARLTVESINYSPEFQNLLFKWLGRCKKILQEEAHPDLRPGEGMLLQPTMHGINIATDDGIIHLPEASRRMKLELENVFRPHYSRWQMLSMKLQLRAFEMPKMSNHEMMDALVEDRK
jgi:hypothetical protein